MLVFDILYKKMVVKKLAIAVKIIFNLLAFTLFTVVFMKMIKKNDTSYVYILVLEFIGIAISFIELFINENINPFFETIMYLFAVFVPALVLIIEKEKKIDFPEMFRLLMANIYTDSGRYDKAKDYLFSLINKYPESYLGHKALARLYEKEGKNENAIDEYIRVTQINNKDLKINFNIANLLNKANKKEEAIKVLQDNLKRNPVLYDDAMLLGDILFESEQYKEASSVYMAALRFHPGDYNIYYSMGMTCTMLNDFQRAKEFYGKAAQINSLAYSANLSLGQIALIYGDLDEAKQYFNESVKGEDTESGSYYYLAQVALLKGEKEKAVNYINIAVKLEPSLYEEIQNDTVFMPILKDIIKPNKETRENARENKMRYKERKCVKHLAKTCMLVSGLNNDDVKAMKNSKKKGKTVDVQRENS